MFEPISMSIDSITKVKLMVANSDKIFKRSTESIGFIISNP